MNLTRHTIIFFLTSLLLNSCGQQSQSQDGGQEESREAKRLLQGVWTDTDTENVVFQIKGDSIFYTDSTSMPAYVKVIGDSIYFGTASVYLVEKHSEHLLWLKSRTGEVLKFAKSSEEGVAEEFQRKRPEILSLTGVLKRDTVVYHDGERYHLYIAVNPTKYKVQRLTVNDDGMEVENSYYDNIIHLSIFQGNRQLYSRDFRKQFYQSQVPSQFLAQAVLNNMEFSKTDDKGFHFDVSLCVPDEASFYQVDQLVTYDGKVSATVME